MTVLEAAVIYGLIAWTGISFARALVAVLDVAARVIRWTAA